MARGEEDLHNFQRQLFSTLTLWSIVSRSSELYSLKDDLIVKVIFQLKRNFDEIVIAWSANVVFNNHIDDLSYGLDRFRDSDWRGCIHTIYPKIEGILRSILIYRVCEYPEDCSFDESEGNCSNCNCSVGYNYFRSEDSLKQAASGFKTGGTSSSGISIPEFMDNYLSNFYFANFPYFRTKTKLSRHSLAHGVVDPEEFNFENAVNGIVILNEIFFNQEESK